MPHSDSRNIALSIQNKAKEAKALFSKALSGKKASSSDRLKSRLKRRSVSEPSKAKNKFVTNFIGEVDRVQQLYDRNDSYRSFEEKLKEIEREANIHVTSSSDSASDLSSLDSADAVQFSHRSWKSTDMSQGARRKVSQIGRTAFATLFASKASRKKGNRNSRRSRKT